MILDAGVFMLAERQPSRLAALLRRIENEPLRTNEAVLAQIWRDPKRQVAVRRLVDRCHVQALRNGSAIGVLLAASGTSDVVDGSVALMALTFNEPVLTSDPDDMKALGTEAVPL
jgi:hypothetical protein